MNPLFIFIYIYSKKVEMKIFFRSKIDKVIISLKCIQHVMAKVYFSNSFSHLGSMQGQSLDVHLYNNNIYVSH